MSDGDGRDHEKHNETDGGYLSDDELDGIDFEEITKITNDFPDSAKSEAHQIPKSQTNTTASQHMQYSNSKSQPTKYFIKPVDSVDENCEQIDPPEKIKIELPESKSLDVFLFHIHEEGPQLFLFCKAHTGESYKTICIQVKSPVYFLQFLPIDGHEYDIAEEVRNIAYSCGGSLISAEMKDMFYTFEDQFIPRKTAYYCAIFSSNSTISRIRHKGNHYSHVFGITANLTENFYLHRDISGPSWIHVTNLENRKQLSTVPQFSVEKIEDISPVDANIMPTFNICTVAIRSMFHSHEIFLISIRVLKDWDLDDFNGIGTRSISFVCSNSEAHVANDAQESDQLIICGDETELLMKFAKTIDEYDIDIFASFGLSSVDIPLLYDRFRERKVENWWRIGRLRRNYLPKITRPDTLMSLSGRVPCDLRINCIDYMRAKSNDLSAAVQTQFGIERQLIDHFETVYDIEEVEKLHNLVNYNSRDTLYIAQLLNALEVLPLGVQISQLSGAQWVRVLFGRTSYRCESLLLKHFYKRGYVLPDKVITNQRKEPAFPGGLVLQPKRGFYQTCIVVLDYYSLYPSIIREFNICFTTVDLKNPNALKSKSNKIKGVLPEIMEELLGQRAIVQREIEQINQQLNEIEAKYGNIKHNYDAEMQEQTKIPADNFYHKIDIQKFQMKEDASMLSQIRDFEIKKSDLELELQRHNTRQLALKMLANAMYGYLGYRHSRFQANELAALVAQQGRIILQRTVEIVEKTGKNTVVYGDTDSVMIDSGTTDVDKAISIAKEIAESVSQQFQFLKLGIEGVFLRMLLVTKKRYVALVYDGPNQSHQETKGIELIRRDWCGLTKYVSAYIIEQFLHSNERDIAISNIISELARINEMFRNNGIPPDQGIIPQPLNFRRKSLIANNQNSVIQTQTQTSQLTQQSTQSDANKRKHHHRRKMKILPTIGFPQMYGVIREKKIKEIPLNVKLKHNSMFPKHGKETSFSILRAYGIPSRYTVAPNENSQEFIEPLEKITLEHLVIHVTLTKPISKYQDKKTPHVVVAQRMEERGEHVAPNMTIAFLVGNDPQSADLSEKVKIPDEIKSVSETDVEWYLSNQILNPIWRLCEPFGGMDVGMIARALELTIPRSYEPPQRDECVAIIIPHVCEMIYKCQSCSKMIAVSEKLRESLVCGSCGHEQQWKYVANQLTTFLRNFLLDRKYICDGHLCEYSTCQLPVSTLKSNHRYGCLGKLTQDYTCQAIFQTLKYFCTFFEPSKNPLDIPYEDFRQYMHNYISNIFNVHGFVRIKLSSLFSQSSSGVSQLSYSNQYSETQTE